MAQKVIVKIERRRGEVILKRATVHGHRTSYTSKGQPYRIYRCHMWKEAGCGDFGEDEIMAWEWMSRTPWDWE